MKKIKNSLGLIAALCLVVAFYECASADSPLAGILILAVGIALLVITDQTPD